MCGINGIARQFSGQIRLTDVRLVESMNSALSHRGPDASAVWRDPAGQCTFGHTRLSILDLSPAGAQPMVSTDGRIAMTFNGEVYNFPSLRDELEQLGYGFRGHSDSEVVLNSFHAWGDVAIKRFNGMFAVAFFDLASGEVTLARDRYGIKPLFYAISDDGSLIFSSEIKGILATDLVQRKANLAALPEYLFYGNALGQRTMYEGIKKLFPGHLIKVTRDRGSKKVTISPYWTVATSSKSRISFHEAVSEVSRRLEAAVKRQLIADVPVGVFLSGGVDSSAITVLAARHYQGTLNTYSIGFDYTGLANELPVARQLAAQARTDHHELHVAGGNIIDTIEHLVVAHDGPFGDAANIPLFQMARALKGEVKVVLQGDGGDELFAGYRRYEYLALNRVGQVAGKTGATLLNLLAPLLGQRAIAPLRFARALGAQSYAERMARLLTVETPENSPLRILTRDIREQCEIVDPFLRYHEIAASLPPGDVVDGMLRTDMVIVLPDLFLEKVDRATMAQSLETRVPFLDNDLVDFVLELPTHYKVQFGQKKKLLRAALRGIVPDMVLDRRKVGFGVPFGEWMRGSLRGVLLDLLHTSHTAGWLDCAVIEAALEDHCRRRADHSYLLWKCLQLAVWLCGGRVTVG